MNGIELWLVIRNLSHLGREEGEGGGGWGGGRNLVQTWRSQSLRYTV